MQMSKSDQAKQDGIEIVVAVLGMRKESEASQDASQEYVCCGSTFTNLKLAQLNAAP